jgi:flagellar protein FlaJ
MTFKIPYLTSNLEALKISSTSFISRITYKKKSNLGKILKSSDIPLNREEYLGICVKSFVTKFLFLSIFFTIVLYFTTLSMPYVWGTSGGLVASFFTLMNQLMYPKLYASRKQRDIEKNLLPALEDILIQLNSGIPLFNILMNISIADYGALSREFKKIVNRINVGEPEVVVLEKIGERNPSIFFRRALWQISNGMKSGSDMGIVISDSIKALSQEQLIQVQNYGSTLNPLIVMYMLISVIVPALSVTFLTILSSMMGLDKTVSMMLFIGIFIFNILFQVIFLGMIKSKRPSLF